MLSSSRWLLWESEAVVSTDVDLKDIYPQTCAKLETYDWNTKTTDSAIQIIGRPNHGKSHLLKHICQQVKKRTTRVLIEYFHDLAKNSGPSTYVMLAILLHQVLSQRPDSFHVIERLVREYLRWGTLTESNLWMLLSTLITKCAHGIQFAIAVDFEQFQGRDNDAQDWLKSLRSFLERHSTNFLYIVSIENEVKHLMSTASIVLNVDLDLPSKESQERYREIAFDLAIKNSSRFRFLQDGRNLEIRRALAAKAHVLDSPFVAPGFYTQFLSSHKPELLSRSLVTDQINIGPSSLADLYEYQIQMFKRESKLVLDWYSLGISWVLHGFRFLRLEELAVAAAINLADDSFENLDSKISRDVESDLNRHLSLFLRIENRVVRPEGSIFHLCAIPGGADTGFHLAMRDHTQLTLLCLHYLQMALLRPKAGKEWENYLLYISSPWEKVAPIGSDIPPSMEFVDYAVRNWIKHYHQADTSETNDDLHKEVIKFLSNPQLLERWLQAYGACHGEASHASIFRATAPSPAHEVEVLKTSKDTKTITALDVANYFGFKSLVNILEEPTGTPTPSIYTIKVKHGYHTRTQLFPDTSTEEFIRALICHGEMSQIESFIKTEQPKEAELLATSVYLAAQCGRLDVLKLLAQAECSSKVISESEEFVSLGEPNVLRGAVIGGRSDVVEYLLNFEGIRSYVTSLAPPDWGLVPLLALELETVPTLDPIKSRIESSSPSLHSVVIESAGYSSPQNFYFIEKLFEKRLIPEGSEEDAVHVTTKWTDLHFAIQSESFGIVKFVLTSEYCRNHAAEFINRGNDAGWTGLHIAAALGRADVVEELLKLGANVKTKNLREDTPIEVAAKHGHLHVLRLLSPKENGSYISILHTAAKAGQLLIVAYILDLQRAKSDPSDEKQYEAALIEAAKRGYAEVVRVLLPTKVNLDCEVDLRRTALHYAAQEGHLEVAKILIENGASINPSDYVRNSPLHLAAINGKTDIARLLIDKGAEVDAQNRNGSSPLHLATSHLDMVALLLRNTTDINITDSQGRSPLIMACTGEKERPEVVKLLLSAGSNVAVSDVLNKTALQHAATNNHLDTSHILCEHLAEVLHLAGPKSPEILKLILEWEPKLDWSATINIRDEDGYTAFCDTAYYNQIESARTLLKFGADPNLATKRNWFPLHVAYDSADMSEFLISESADIEVLTFESRTSPLMLACRDGFLATVKVLLSHNARVDQENILGQTALHLTAASGHYEIANLLLGHWDGPPIARIPQVADVGKKDQKGYTPLHLAIRNDHPKVVKLLIQEGSDIRANTGSGDTCLDLAMELSGASEVLGILLSENKNISPPAWPSQDLHRLVEKHMSSVLDNRILPFLEAEQGLLESGILDPVLLGLRYGDLEFEERQERLAIEILNKGFNPFETRLGSKLSVFQSSFITRSTKRQKFIDACIEKLPKDISGIGNGFRELRTAIEYRDSNLWQHFSSLRNSASQICDEDGWTLDHFTNQAQISDPPFFVEPYRVLDSSTLTPKSLVLPDSWKRWNLINDVETQFELSNEGTHAENIMMEREIVPGMRSAFARTTRFPLGLRGRAISRLKYKALKGKMITRDQVQLLSGCAGNFHSWGTPHLVGTYGHLDTTETTAVYMKNAVPHPALLSPNTGLEVLLDVE
ncbi:hypothetical protein TWF281_004578 [Arthrobotrys megalospora]